MHAAKLSEEGFQKFKGDIDRFKVDIVGSASQRKGYKLDPPLISEQVALKDTPQPPTTEAVSSSSISVHLYTSV